MIRHTGIDDPRFSFSGWGSNRGESGTIGHQISRRIGKKLAELIQLSWRERKTMIGSSRRI